MFSIDIIDDGGIISFVYIAYGYEFISIKNSIFLGTLFISIIIFLNSLGGILFYINLYDNNLDNNL